ncbi:Outer membrane lipoprotein Omp16 [Aliiroseovarius pelagivivens]|uniref:Outer membrane lipoprotein Omp16 n=1 Tax=Aliiroseovarius pelagivivens TaxID=1639690 RepID=A0A2R8AIM2_9RHOB|nr:OmpA family protein [Aliiroseovarius pelagivivens]SPF75891.1 Outer membrane lipoprotein Omp16 [Aliiroseovarius pelagivivens]
MKRIKPILAATSVIAVLSGCADNPQAMHFWLNEAGGSLDEGGFGAPTAHNIGVHTGQINVVQALAERFSREVGDTVNFEFNKADLSPEARSILDTQAKWILQFPEIRFRVYGHTDLVGSTAYNNRLGMRRARTVVNYLVSRGISRSRLEAVVSYGETRPLIQTDQRELRNRRTVTEVSGFANNRKATLLDGKYAEIINREYIESATTATEVANGNVGTVE